MATTPPNVRGLPASNPGDAYFTAMAAEYAKHTGNTTRALFAAVLNTWGQYFSIDSMSPVHDNACGPGTASAALLAWCWARGDPAAPPITATDSNAAMVAALQAQIDAHADAAQGTATAGWKRVKARELDSQRLQGVSGDTFALSVCNFSVFSFGTPLLALQEMHRTLRPKGLAVVTTWKRFAVEKVMSAAKKAVTGGDGGVPVAGGLQFEREGFLAGLVDVAGWERGKIRTVETSVVVKGEELDGLIEFMSGSFSEMVRKGWSDEQNAKWPGAIKDAVEEEKKAHGGMLFEAWVVLARKWDELSG